MPSAGPSLKEFKQLSSFTKQTFVRVVTKVVLNGGCSLCTRDGDNLSLLIKSGNTHKRSMISQTIICIFPLNPVVQIDAVILYFDVF